MRHPSPARLNLGRSVGITALVPVSVFGTEITVAVTGKLKANGVRGPATARLALRAGATTGYVAAVVLLSLAVIVAAATAVEDARAAGIRHAQRISGRDAFAAQVAFEVVGESARTELDSLMAEWRRFPDPEVIETVKRCYNDAGKQVEALHTNGKT